MKLFRKDSGYAVRTLIFIAQQDQLQPVSSTYVSECLGVPKSFLRRIFSKLIRADILRATEGVRGGVVLAKSPTLISVCDVVLALQGDVKICDHAHNHENCKNYRQCPMRKRIIALESRVSEEFCAITIQSLIDENQPIFSE